MPFRLKNVSRTVQWAIANIIITVKWLLTIAYHNNTALFLRSFRYRDIYVKNVLSHLRDQKATVELKRCCRFPGTAEKLDDVFCLRCLKTAMPTMKAAKRLNLWTAITKRHPSLELCTFFRCFVFGTARIAATYSSELETDLQTLFVS